MTAASASIERLVAVRRARDLIDRSFASPLDVATMAARAHMSPAHFTRVFREAYGETPYGYLMTRRIERAMTLLRAGASVTDACVSVGATSLGSFSSRFTEITGETPSAYRDRDHAALEAMPDCIARLVARPPYLRGDRAPSRDGAPSGDRAGSEKHAAAGVPTVVS